MILIIMTMMMNKIQSIHHWYYDHQDPFFNIGDKLLKLINQGYKIDIVIPVKYFEHELQRAVIVCHKKDKKLLTDPK